MYTAPIALIFRLVFDVFAEKVYLCSFFVKTFLIYICGAPDINSFPAILLDSVVICFKIRIFAVQSTSANGGVSYANALWFALKFVSLWCNRHPYQRAHNIECVVICFKIRIFVVQSTSTATNSAKRSWLWFALKFVSLWCNRHRCLHKPTKRTGCDLL